jgi:hypothetical protein
MLLLAASIYFAIACGATASSSSSADDDTSDDDASPADDDSSPVAGESVWADTTTGLTWQNGSAVGASTASFGQGGAASYCTSLNWAGYASGWRLPTITELRSLIRGCPGTITGGSCNVTDNGLDEVYDNSPCGGCGSLTGPGAGGAYWPAAITAAVGAYWSSVGDETDPTSNGWEVDFTTGEITYNSLTDNYSAICVRGGTVPPVQTVWTDTTTGHMWQNGGTVGAANLQATQGGAGTYCSGLTWAGYTGWRLPTISELRTLIQGCAATVTGGSCTVTDTCLNESCDNSPCGGCSSMGNTATPVGAYWPAAIGGNPGLYWSSELDADNPTSNGWQVDFTTGQVTYNSVTDNEYVRCIRN